MNTIKKFVWFYGFIISLIVCAQTSTAQTLASQQAAYVGSQSCKTCHQEAYQKWQTSHHFQAMLKADQHSVRGDFDNAVFEYAGLKHRFTNKNGKYYVTTDNADGQLETFEIAYTFGFTPLQQYLIAMPDGRYQTLSITWDDRPQKQGGQHWYHLYPDETIKAGDALHWTGHYQNWNTRCAACHSTDLQKNYQIESNTFSTTFSEINVACEACHGPAENHLKWAQSTTKNSQKNTDKGILSLSDAGNWTFSPGQKIAHRVDKKHPTTQVDTCASCHSLRTELKPMQAGTAFSDQHGLRLLETAYYQTDGQVREEVYVYGSFLQSKMAEAGVVCSNCHDAHSGEVIGGKENVCMQCHDSQTYNRPSHHQHTVGQAGSFCVDCHMPETTYMGVDARRDHSFRIPHPELSDEFNTSNACTGCHNKKSNAWATQQREFWPNKKLLSAGPDVDYTRLLAASNAGDPGVLTPLIELINNPKQPYIKRATALLNLANYPSQPAFSTSMAILQDDSALLRAAAIRSLAYVPQQKRRGYVSLLNDSSKSVRMELAPFLAGLSTQNMPEAITDMMGELYREYIQLQMMQADQPSAQLSLGNFYLSLNASAEAIKAYQQALVISPSFVPALLNLSDLYRQFGDEKQAILYLQQAVTKAPDSASAAHAMGLAKIRIKQNHEAMNYLKKAVELNANNSRFAYVYAVALHSDGQVKKALAAAQAGLKTNGNSPELLQFMVSTLQAEGRYMEAAGYKSRLDKLTP
ncbi:MAG: tetratricopeptide repeat protein [Pseudomonadales bacterium]|nr:tetratricopeptide repeat protein [Pseudomonadales bacterium]